MNGMTYGICVSDPKYLNKIISDITTTQLTDRNYEIIFANQEDWWITKKKNWIAEQAKYDTLCLIHDYVSFPSLWHTEIKKFFAQKADDFDVLMTEVITYEGKRGPDWLLSPYWMEQFFKYIPELSNICLEANPSENHPKYVNALPYNEKSLTKYQYVSGAYILTKTDYMRKHPFNESLMPGSAEDLDWFETHKPRLDINRFTWVKFLKPHKWAVTEIPAKGLELIKHEFV